jgi:membrane protease YdiL (CAAX protease family)
MTGAIALPLAAVGMLAAGEILIAEGQVLAAQLLDSVLLLVLANLPDGAWLSSRPERAAAAVHTARGLTVVALARVVTIALPVGHRPLAVDEVVVGALIGFATLRMAPRLGVDLRSMLVLGASVAELAAVVGGAVLGVVAYYLGSAASVRPGAGASLVVGAVVAATLTAAVEELLFRGLLQSLFGRLARWAGVLAPSVLFGFTYAGAGPAALVLVMAFAGLLFACVVNATGRLGGALAGHATLSLAAGVVLPAVIGPRAPGTLSGETTSWIVIALAMVGSFAAGYALRRAQR